MTRSQIYFVMASDCCHHGRTNVCLTLWSKYLLGGTLNHKSNTVALGGDDGGVGGGGVLSC